jgi:hypothetical protein
MALTQTQLQLQTQPISLKARGKKRAYEEVDSSPPKTNLLDARARGVILAFVDKVFANFKKVRKRRRQVCPPCT